MLGNITFARVGGPPRNWRDVVVTCNGKPLKFVVEADSIAGYARIFKKDHQNKRFILTPNRDAVQIFTLRGAITIMENTFAKRVEASSQIKSATYHPDPPELRVVFKSTPDALYAYQGVTPEQWQQFLAAPSLGSWLIAQRRTWTFDKRVQPATLAQQEVDFAALLTRLGTPVEAAVGDGVAREAQLGAEGAPPAEKALADDTTLESFPLTDADEEGDEDDEGSDLVDEA